MKYRESEEMYLETILLLQERQKEIRSIDIANELNYTRASVSRAVNLLKEKGYQLLSAQAADLFPRCAHIESIVCLTNDGFYN